MSEPITFEKRFIEVIADTKALCGRTGLLSKDSNGNYEIHNASFNPVGNRFPQICFEYYLGEALEVMPSERANLVVTAWASKTDPAPKTTTHRIIEEVEVLINKRPQTLTDIEIEGNVGLRLVRCVRTSRSSGFESEVEAYYTRAVFDIVKDDRFANYGETTSSEDWPANL